MKDAFGLIGLSILIVAGSSPVMAEDSGIVPVEGARLHYIVEGKGIPCLVIGHAESSRLLCSQDLRDHFRFVFTDLRHDIRSQSSVGLSEITLDTYLEDIDAVSNSLGLVSFVIWGHSHHAYVAFKYAQKHPRKVSGVIMTACTPCDMNRSRRDEFWEADASDERKALFAQTWGEFQKLRSEVTAEERRERPEMPRGPVLAMAARLLSDPTNTLSLAKIARSLRNDRNVYLHYQLEILKDYDLAEESEPVAAPVFLGLGRYDYIAPYTLWNNERRAAFPNLTYHLFSKSGHFPQIEEPELVDSKLIEWIGNQQCP
jgi:proline iminopeptidase